MMKMLFIWATILWENKKIKKLIAEKNKWKTEK